MRRFGWRATALVLTGVGFSVFGLLGHAQAQEAQAPVAFARPEAMVPDDGAVGLTLFNNTTAQLILNVRVAPADAFSVETSASTVPAGGEVGFRVTDIGAEPGSAGRVTVVAVAPGPNPLTPGPSGVARATITVASPDERAEPLVSEWSVTSYRFKPWGDATENDAVPLRGAESCDDVAIPDRTVGGVSASPGVARVVASCREGGVPEADVGAELAFPGLGRHTGDYRGEIDLAPDADGGALALTVRRTDYVLVPLVVALLGVAAAVAGARALGRRDTRASDEREAWLLLAEVDAAHRELAERSRDRAWSGYSFKADADQRLRAVLSGGPEAGDGMADPTGTTEPPAGVRDRLEPVARAAAAWPALADRLAELDVAVTEVGLKASSHRPPGSSASEPACLAAARPLLTAPAHPLTVREALAVAAAVDDAAAMTERWLDWAAAVAQLEGRADLLALAIDDLPADHDDHRALADARSELAEARAALWQAESLADLDGRGAPAAIERARTRLDGLDHHLSGEAVPGEREPAAPVADVPPASALAVALAGGAGASRPSRPGRRRAESARGQGLAGAAVLTATALVAVWSGLSVLYFGEAFGSPRDYAGMFVWAFAAQAVLGTLAGAADRQLMLRR